ncbi:MAG: hypothetical protein EXX96DRAFT_475623, partial [Benjaminiella poitrasii]
DGIMYVFGGHFQRKYLNDLCAFNVNGYPSKAEWDFITYKNQGPSPRSGHVAVTHDKKLYVFGGINASNLYNDIWSFDLLTHTWQQITAVGYIPAPRESCAAALVDDTIYIFGGRGLNGVGLGDLCAFRIKSQRWYMFQSMGTPPSPRYGLSLTVIQNKIYVFGGDSVNGKTDDSNCIYVLDCSKIRYPPEADVDSSSQPETRVTMKRRSSLMQPIRSQVPKQTTHQSLLPSVNESSSPISIDERKSLMREIVARDTIINEMKKKEQWWRTEVSIARHVRHQQKEDETDANTEEENDEFPIDVSLMKFDKEGSQDDEKLLLFQQLVSVKAEVRKIKSKLNKQTEPMYHKIDQIEQLRMTALEEASYYKAKYTALKTRDKAALDLLESDRAAVLEQRLGDVYEAKDAMERELQKIRLQSKHDKEARELAEERAKEAQKQSEKAQEAHQKALEQLTELYQKMNTLEAQGREDAAQLANLSNQLAKQLSLKNASDEENHLKIARLEAANIKSRNEITALLKKLEKGKDDEIELKILLNNKEQAYTEAMLELENIYVELELIRNLSAKRHQSNLIDVATVI